MKRVFVTGATGFLGRRLCDALVSRGDFVVALQRDNLSLDAGYHEPDVFVGGSFEQVERAVAEYEIDSVIHLAAQTQVSVAAKHPESTLEANVLGTWQVLSACRRQGVKHVVVASSDKAYGAGPTPYFETQPLQPHGVYATSKAMADQLAQSYALEYGMHVAITRCGNLFGPGHTNWSTLIPGTIRSCLRGEAPRLRCNGRLKRDYLYVGGAVDGYLRIIDKEATGIFNFGTCVGTDAITVVEEIKRLTGCELPIVFDKEGPGAGGAEIDMQVLDWSKAHRELGWQPTDGLHSGLQKTIPWYRDGSHGR